MTPDPTTKFKPRGGICFLKKSLAAVTGPLPSARASGDVIYFFSRSMSPSSDHKIWISSKFVAYLGENARICGGEARVVPEPQL